MWLIPLPPTSRPGVESPREGWQEAGRLRKRWRLSGGGGGGGGSEPQETETHLQATRGTGETHRPTCPLGGPGGRTQRPRLGGAEQGAGPCPFPALPSPGRHVGRAEAPGGVGAPGLRPLVDYGGVSQWRRRDSGSPGLRVESSLRTGKCGCRDLPVHRPFARC